MARLYAIPMELEQEEKTIGGVLTVKQLLYLFFAGAMLVVTIFLMRVFDISWLWSIAVGVALWVPLGLFLAFFTKDGMSGDQLLLTFLSFITRPRRYLWGE